MLTIQPNELRLGNWIRDGHDYEKVTPRVLDMLVKHEADFDPIPITKKLIEVLKLDTGEPWELRFNLEPATPKADGWDLWLMDEYVVSAGIKNLHDLQNLYFVIFGKDLPVLKENIPAYVAGKK